MPESVSSRGSALDAGLDVIEHLSTSNGVSVTDLAGRLGVDKGNLHRTLKALQGRGYVSQDPHSKLYRLTAKPLVIAGHVLRNLDLRAAAEDPCARLLEETGETVHAAQRISDGVVYVLKRSAPFRVSVATEVGQRPPLHCTATGKAVLAFLDDDERSGLLHDGAFEPHTLRTHRDGAALARDLEETRRRGYAVDDEELNIGVRCVAAPVFGFEGDVIGCIGVSGPVSRIDLSTLERYAGLVVERAAQVTSQLGGTVPAVSS